MTTRISKILLTPILFVCLVSLPLLADQPEGNSQSVSKGKIFLPGKASHELVVNKVFDSQKKVFLPKEVLFVVEADVRCIIKQFPTDQKIVSVIIVRNGDSAGDVVIFGRFYDNPSVFAARKFNGKYIYVITSQNRGECELLILPLVGSEDDALVVKLVTDGNPPSPLPPSPPSPPSPLPPTPPSPSPVEHEIDKDFVSDLVVALKKDIANNGIKEIDHCQSLGGIYENVGKAILSQGQNLTVGKVYEIAFEASRIAGIPRRDVSLQSTRSVVEKWFDKKLQEQIDPKWTENTPLTNDRILKMSKIMIVAGNSLKSAANLAKPGNDQ